MTGKIGLTSYAFYWATQGSGTGEEAPLTAWGMLDKTVSLDLDVIQICEHVPLIEWEATQIDALRLAAAARGVSIEVGSRGLDTDYLRRAVAAAARLGSPILRLVPWSGEPTRRELSLSVLERALEPILPLCRESNITLAIENYFDLPDTRLAEYMQRCGGDHLGVCLDTANSTGLLQEPLQTVQLLAPFTVALHLKDFVITKSMSGYSITGAPLGKGWLDVPAVLDIIARTGRNPTILLEQWVEPAATRDATLRIEDQWVAESVAHLRSVLGSP